MACKGTLYFVGAGLSSRHLTREAIEAISSSDLVYIDAYTSFYENDLRDTVIRLLEGRKSEIKTANRSDLEDHSNEKILKPLLEGKTVSIVVVGDPFIATTHQAVRVDVLRLGCRVKYVPGVNVYSYAISLSGLFNYKFGASATIVYPPEEGRQPSVHAYNVIEKNKQNGLHTFLFLDIHPRRGPMTPSHAMEILLSIESSERRNVISPRDRILVLSRLGFADERVYYTRVSDVLGRKWDNPPYSIIVPGKLNRIESEALEVLWLEQHAW